MSGGAARAALGCAHHHAGEEVFERQRFRDGESLAVIDAKRGNTRTDFFGFYVLGYCCNRHAARELGDGAHHRLGA